jgi:hypothetical protein
MKTKLSKFLFIALFMAVAGSCCMFDPAEAADARDLFISKCCNCHREGGEAAAIGPTYHASFQWKKFFEADRHSRRKDIKGLITPEETEALKNFLMKHASDSDQPEGIGIAVQKGK